MEKIIEFRASKFYFVLASFVVILIACVWAAYRIFEIEFVMNTKANGGIWIFFIALVIVFLEFFIALIQWITRKVSGKAVFKISEKGLENVYCSYNFMIFFLMPSAELIPWSAIRGFKLFTWTGGRKYVVAEINEAKLIPQTSKLFRLQVRRSSAGTMRGLYFGSRSAEMPADELIRVLKEYHQKYAN